MLKADDEVLERWLFQSSTGSSARQAAIDAAAQELKRAPASALLGLVALAYGQPSSEAVGLVSTAVKLHDDSFRGRPSDAQTRIAAAWAVAKQIGSQSPKGVTAGLLVQAAEFSGMSSSGPELPRMAEQRVDRACDSARRRVALPDLEAATVSASGFDETIPVTVADLTKLQRTISSVNETLTTSVTALKGVGGRLDAADEEIDLLWWTMHGRDGATGKTWADLGHGAPILAGAEFATLTSFPTPIDSAYALFVRTVGTKKISVRTAVEAAATHKVGFAVQHRSPVLPLTSCLALAADELTDDWTSAATDLSITLSTKKGFAEIALQMLRECLVIPKL